MLNKFENWMLSNKVFYWTMFIFVVILISSIFTITEGLYVTFVINNFYIGIVYLIGILIIAILDFIFN